MATTKRCGGKPTQTLSVTRKVAKTPTKATAPTKTPTKSVAPKTTTPIPTAPTKTPTKSVAPKTTTPTPTAPKKATKRISGGVYENGKYVIRQGRGDDAAHPNNSFYTKEYKVIGKVGKK